MKVPHRRLGLSTLAANVETITVISDFYIQIFNKKNAALPVSFDPAQGLDGHPNRHTEKVAFSCSCMLGKRQGLRFTIELTKVKNRSAISK